MPAKGRRVSQRRVAHLRTMNDFARGGVHEEQLDGFGEETFSAGHTRDGRTVANNVDPGQAFKQRPSTSIQLLSLSLG